MAMDNASAQTPLGRTHSTRADAHITRNPTSIGGGGPRHTSQNIVGAVVWHCPPISFPIGKVFIMSR
eukprot:3402802-Pyramimonas_sp.AAC.1